MIVCSCMRISDRDIRAAIAWMRAADPHTLITPGKVYRALGKAPDCGGCIRLFVAEMRRSRALEVPAERTPAEVPSELRTLRLRNADTV
jgi:bacterioferritin-associated ferredoxin